MIILMLGFLGWMYLAYLNARRKFTSCVPRSIRGGGGGGDEAPAVPTYMSSFPDWAKALPQEQLDLIHKYINSPLQTPSQYGQAQGVYDKLLNYSPQNFQYPMADIQKALDAQQGLQLENYKKQINPVLANQGQLDSSYHTNLLSDFLKNQQSQSLTNTANLLTNQATQNYDLSKWLPQFQGQVASGLQGLGGANLALNSYNQQLPAQGASSLGGVFGEGLDLGDRMYKSAMEQYQNALDQYNNKQAGQQGLFRSLGFISPIGGALYGGIAGGSQGLASSLGGSVQLAQAALPFMMGGMGSGLGGLGAGLGTGMGNTGSYGTDLSSIYSPNWNNYTSQPSYMNYGKAF